MGRNSCSIIVFCDNDYRFITSDKTNIEQSSENENKTYYTNLSFRDNEYHLQFDLVRRKSKELIPYYTLLTENPTKEDKLQSIVKCLIYNSKNSTKIKEVNFIRGDSAKTCKIYISTLLKDSKKILAELKDLQSGTIATKPFWKNHCQICQFQAVCRKELQKKDDLSLLTSLSSKEIKKKNSKGIFTTTQLSYFFRPGKKLYSKKRFLPELKSLALREKKIFIINSPKFTNTEVEIFFDIEGIPNSKNFYLIGLIVREKDNIKKYCFWRDKGQNQIDIFINFLDVIASYENCTLYHFGSFEISAMKHAAKIIEHEKYQAIISTVIQNSVDILKEFYENIYTPTYTNSLKDIANYLGFEWKEKELTGYKCIFLRKKWELKKEGSIKASLICYNIDDCKALILVKDWLNKISENREENEGIAKVSDINIQSTFKFGETDYIIPELKEINQFAYFNYQRDKIYLKTNKLLKVTANRKVHQKHPPKPNQFVIS